MQNKIVRVLFQDGRTLIDQAVGTIQVFGDTVLLDGILYREVKRVWVGRV